MMNSKIQKWGNSLAVRIPKAFAEEAGFEENSEVEMALIDDAVVITRKKRMTFNLKELLDQITPENLHAEIDTGTELGAEIL